MALSNDAVNRLCIALTDAGVGSEVANAINGAPAKWMIVAATLSATTSTTQFSNLLKGDIVMDFTTPSANGTVATAGTLPHAPTSADVLVVLRAVPAAVSFKF